jgi:hypothetical protein
VEISDGMNLDGSREGLNRDAVNSARKKIGCGMIDLVKI